MADHTKPQHQHDTHRDHDSSSPFLRPHQPSDLPRKGSKLETLSHQPFKKKPKTLNLSEQGQFNGDDKTLVKPDSQLPKGKQEMDTDNDMRSMIDMELLDDFNSGENALDGEDDDSGYDFVTNDNDEFDEITSHRQLKYTNLCEDDIQQRQEEDIARVATVLSISRASACCLLRHHNWSVSKVHDAWFADEENVRKTVGLLEKPTLLSPNAKKMTCGICFETHQLSSMSAAVCGHYFCASCWEGYISTSIKDGPGCLMLRCPDPSCAAAVGQDMINLLVSDKDKAKYSRYLLRSYIEDNKRIKWCPAPGCDYAVEFIGSESYDVSCNCAYNFCWNCLEEAHRPVDCDTVSKWLSKNTAESGNVNWILAYSKPCPKCKRPIEKNMGCMHMSCPAPCSFQFCWLCLGSWESHYHRSGRVNPCNGYNKVKQEGASNDDEARREMAKKSLEKYTHYFERWDANQKSRQKAILDLQQMQSVHMEKLSNRQCQLDSQLKFITEAWQQIIECRRVLMWTYAYGYYLPQHEDAKMQLFEYLQGEAESGLERLHQCAEQDLRIFLNAEEPCKGFNEFRIKLAGLTTVTRNYFENLVNALENGLADVNSHGACSKADTSKGSGGDNKGRKHGKGKGTTSKSGGVGHDLNDPMGSWSCEHCSFSNNNSATICQMCNQRWGSWSCKHCTFFNRRSASICQMCEQER